MQQASIKRRLGLLCGGLLGVALVVGTVEYIATVKLNTGLVRITTVETPALQSMTLADMMHDGLRAVTYRALYLAMSEGSSEDKKEVAGEAEEMSKNLSEHLGSLEALPLSDEIKNGLSKTIPEAQRYTEVVKKVVTLSINNQRAEAEKSLPELNASFRTLEKEMEVLGEAIEKEVTDYSNQAQKDASFFKVLSLTLLITGISFGIGLSLLFTKKISQTLSQIIGSLAQSSQKVSSASQQSASSSTELSEAATEQAASLQETMASVEEISAMVNQNADSATKVQGAVQLNQQASEEGSQSVAEMLGAIDEIKSTNDQILSQMETSNKEFAEIVKIISEIGDKTKVINDIVFQTKLLSFNASVEAARAGEHGKGFAVVAEEVGNLAQMSGNAAKQITDMLSNSIKKVNDIVDQSTHRIDQLVEVGKDKISMGQSTAQKCQQALQKISANAQTVVTMIGEITNASKEQAQGIQEINKAISQLDQVTQQNSAVAQQASTQAEQLSAEASSLSNAVHTLVNFVEGSATGQGTHAHAPSKNVQKATHSVNKPQRKAA